MSKELEIEFKNMLTKIEFEQLIMKYFPTTPAFSQTNCYFDTPNTQLKELSMGLRLRKRVGKNECTLKIPTKNEHAYQEITDNLTEEQITHLIKEKRIYAQGEVARYLESINVPINELNMIGSLTTNRREKKLNNNTLLVVDENYFDKMIDFELEMEVTVSSQGEQFFNDFLIKEEIKRRPASKKIARMIEYRS
ncbi:MULTISPECIES: CYTH domain-containing protein [Enterococcaceae]|uniref:CYTH domain-containing protein n=1 Tax=Enterococcaceae TaxID=81852 RepID=UPI000E487E18|nr:MULTISPECIES: CYTH domain-containing protein [Enterococcaceae]MCI0130778.1 CYTH domain-containing protein [Vagococcus sp. CY53-2]RGI30168.1 CYTH domain-containing protein [Melissococcus sp. OM08-11BH]UNM89167.1 CYTH domain-containing protein [Vagococcus sp. CY52-2]